MPLDLDHHGDAWHYDSHLPMSLSSKEKERLQKGLWRNIQPINLGKRFPPLTKASFPWMKVTPLECPKATKGGSREKVDYTREGLSFFLYTGRTFECVLTIYRFACGSIVTNEVEYKATTLSYMYWEK